MADNLPYTPGAGASVATDDVGGVHYQRIKLVHGVDGSAVDASGANPLPVTGPLTDAQLRAADLPIKLDSTGFTFSAAGTNSSTTQLAAAAFFTGTWESVVDQPAFSILAGSDQPGTLIIEQAIDAAGAQIVQTLTYSHLAGGSVSRSGVLNGNYVRVRYQNTGASTSTTLRIDTAYGAILPATQRNNLPVSVDEISGTALTLGQATAAASLPVVLASNAPTVRDSAGTAITSTTIAGKQRLDVTLAAGGTPGAAAPTTADLVAGTDGTNLRALLTDTAGRLSTAIAALGGLPLPTGANLPVVGEQPAVTSYPSAQSRASTGTIQYGVIAGSTIILTLTNAPAATATWVGTVAFETSADGSSWSAVSATPMSSLPGAGAVNVTQATAVGLWRINIPTNHSFFRCNVTAWTSGTIWTFVETYQTNAVIQLPWSPTVTSGQTLVPYFDASMFSEIALKFSAVTTCVFTVQATNDPAGTDVSSLPAFDITNNISGGALTIGNAVPWRIQLQGHKWARIQCTTTGTVATVQGVTARLGQPVMLSSYGSAVRVLLNNDGVNIAQINGQVPLSIQYNGSTNRGIVAGAAGPTANVDYSAQAWAAASGSGGTIINAQGLGASTAFDVNLTAWTAGSSTGLVVYLQESPDNGTTWYDIWQCETLTAVSRARIPAIPVGGRRRMRWLNLSGAATTATVTVTAMDCSVAVVKQVQWFDRTASVTSGTAALGNGAAYDIAGCKALTFVMQTGTATAPASFKIQMSMSGAANEWYDASAPVSCPASSMTPIPLTSGVFGRFARYVCTTAGTTALVTAGHIYGTN